MTHNIADPATWPTVDPDPGPWQTRARCLETDPDSWFPEPTSDSMYAAKTAKRVCMSCEVRAECLAEAIATDQRHGIWGGLSYQERKKLVENQAAAEAA